MFNWIKKLFCPSEEDLKILSAIDKLCKEYDVIIGSGGSISKTSKPEYVEKHRKELNEAFPEIRREIRKNGFCKIKG